MRTITEDNEPDIVVGIDNDKNSQNALKWAADNLVGKGRHITLVHVRPKTSTIVTSSGSHLTLCEVSEEVANAFKSTSESIVKETFKPFKEFCTRKNLEVNEVTLEDDDIVNALCYYVKVNSTRHLVLGAQTRSYFSSFFKSSDVPGSVTKEAPEFCNLYVINNRGKVGSVRQGVGLPPPSSKTPQMPNSYSSPNLTTLRTNLSGRQSYSTVSNTISPKKTELPFTSNNVASRASFDTSSLQSNNVASRASFDTSRLQSNNVASRASFDTSSLQSNNVASRASFDTSSLQSNSVASMLHNDISSVQSKAYSSDSNEPLCTSHVSNYSVPDFRYSPNSPLTNLSSQATINVGKFSSYSSESSDGSMHSSEYMDEVDAEMRRLKEEIKQKMAMYNTACKETETLTAKHKALKGEKAIEAPKGEKAIEAPKGEKAAGAPKSGKKIVKRDETKKVKGEKTAGAPKSAKKIDKRKETRKVHNVVANSDVRYHRYTIEEIEVATDNFSSSKKIGEGGYGQVYKCYLDHTPAAIKVLHPDTIHGTSQLHREVEVLSNIRHPNLVNLLGACPENGCLVYEYIENRSLDDCLQALSWQARFRISAEIATALLFLHHNKPEPLVHRNLKPENILLDQNYVSKISDVRLGRLVRSADTQTINSITKTAGKLSYIDPEYQLTGMLGTKSDVYSFGVMLLHIITGKSAMGSHHVESAIETGTLSEVLDPAVPDWPVEAALSFAKIALKCTKLRRQDRPNLPEVLPELNRLRDLAQESMPS